MITLLTDFGLSDAYVGLMKGVILGINPTATLVDLSHQIPPQDVRFASFQLASAFAYFPPGTIHLVVVDPGVGSQRQAIAVELEDSILVGPNNGVFSQVLHQVQPRLSVSLDNPRYWLTPTPSTTFHGRDIFAPVAAHLSCGMSIAQVGTPLPLDLLQIDGDETLAPDSEGRIQSIDHFGNLITTLPGKIIPPGTNWGVVLADQWIPGHGTYSDIRPGAALALIGSHGWIEVAVNQGSAQAQLQAKMNDLVRWQSCP